LAGFSSNGDGWKVGLIVALLEEFWLRLREGFCIASAAAPQVSQFSIEINDFDWSNVVVYSLLLSLVIIEHFSS